MKTSAYDSTDNRRGMTLIEVMVALTVFTIAILVLASTGVVAYQTLEHGDDFAHSATIAQTKLDSLTALGWAALGPQTGSDTVASYPVSWVVQDSNPRRIILVVEREAYGNTMADTFVTYVAQ